MSNNPWADAPEEKEMLADIEGGEGGRKIDNMKFKEGRNAIRIVGTYRCFKEHWFPKVKRTAVCPGKTCPFCNSPEQEKLMKEAVALADKVGEKGDERVKAAFRKAYSFKPRIRYAVNVLDRTDGKVKVWRFSRTMKEGIMAIIEEHGDPNGFDLIVMRKGTDRDTKYSVTAARDHEPLTEEEKALEPFNLSVLLKPTTPEKIKAYMRGEIPQRKASTQSTTSSAVVDAQEPVETPEVPEEFGEGFDDSDFGDI